MKPEGNAHLAMLKGKKIAHIPNTDEKAPKPGKAGKVGLGVATNPGETHAFEVPEFEYEYLQEKLYLEELFNTFYLSFGNNGKITNNQTAPVGAGPNTAQFLKLMQQEKALAGGAQKVPMQAGMAFEEKPEAPIPEQKEVEAVPTELNPGPNQAEAAQSLNFKMRMLLKAKEAKVQPLENEAEQHKEANLGDVAVQQIDEKEEEEEFSENIEEKKAKISKKRLKKKRNLRQKRKRKYLK